jgi:hypothetical protein
MKGGAVGPMNGGATGPWTGGFPSGRPLLPLPLPFDPTTAAGVLVGVGLGVAFFPFPLLPGALAGPMLAPGAAADVVAEGLALVVVAGEAPALGGLLAVGLVLLVRLGLLELGLPVPLAVGVGADVDFLPLPLAPGPAVAGPGEAVAAVVAMGVAIGGEMGVVGVVLGSAAAGLVGDAAGFGDVGAVGDVGAEVGVGVDVGDATAEVAGAGVLVPAPGVCPAGLTGGWAARAGAASATAPGAARASSAAALTRPRWALLRRTRLFSRRTGSTALEMSVLSGDVVPPGGAVAVRGGSAEQRQLVPGNPRLVREQPPLAV